jgi:hypothetical protein
MDQIITLTNKNSVGFSTRDVKRHRNKSPMQRIHYEFCIIVRPGPLGLFLQPDPPRGIKVVQVYQDSPYKNIIQNNDRIVSVNFYSVEIATLHDLKLLLGAEGSKTLLVERCLERPVTIAMANSNMVPYPYTFTAKSCEVPRSLSLLEHGEVSSMEDIGIVECDPTRQDDNDKQQKQHIHPHESNGIKAFNTDTPKNHQQRSIDQSCKSSRVGEQLLKQPMIAHASESSQNAKVKRKSSKSTKKSLLSTSNHLDNFDDLTLATSIASVKNKIKTASLAATASTSASNHHLRGVTMRPSGKWQAQFYFAGKSQYIGVFDSREKAALAYEIAREHLKNRKARDPSEVESRISAARKAAFEGVNEIWGDGSGEKRNSTHGQQVNGAGMVTDYNCNDDEKSEGGHGNGHAQKTRVANGIKHGANGTTKLLTKKTKSPSKKKRSYDLSFRQSQDDEKSDSVRMTSDDDDTHNTSHTRDNGKGDIHNHFIVTHDDNDDKSSSTFSSTSANNDGRNSYPKSTCSKQSPQEIHENDTVGTDSTQDDDTPEPQQPPFTPTKLYSKTNTDGQSPTSTLPHHCGSFDERFEELKEFVQKYGHCDIHRDSKINQSLGTWCDSTRDTYHNQMNQGDQSLKKRKLSQKEIEHLEGIGFKWTLSPPNSYSRPTTNGLTSSPCSTPHPINAKCQEEDEEEKENEKHQRHQELEEPSQDEFMSSQESPLGKHGIFDERFQQLAAFYDRYGHCDVPSQWKINPALGLWCFNLRQAYHKLQKGRRANVKLSKDEIERLESIGFKWFL